MRGLKKNEVLLYYSLYEEDSRTDEWGNTVGGYGEPEPIFGSLSLGKGATSAQVFGLQIDYDRELLVHDEDCPINEYSRLWIDNPTTKDHDYTVTMVARSHNCTRYAIKRVAR